MKYMNHLHKKKTQHRANETLTQLTGNPFLILKACETNFSNMFQLLSQIIVYQAVTVIGQL
jgi:uncharacterized protein YegL